MVPLLDADLAGRLPTAWVGARRQLADPVTHGLVRLAADELATQLRGRGQEPYPEQLDRPPARPTLLRDPAQLPEGMRRLAAVLDDVGPAVAAADVRSVTRLLALGVEFTDRRARAAGQSGAADACICTAASPPTPNRTCKCRSAPSMRDLRRAISSTLTSARPTDVSSRLTDGCLGGSNSVEAEARSSQDRPTALPSSSPIVSGSSRPAGRQQQQARCWHGGAFAELGVAHSLRLRVRRLDPICNADGYSNRSN